MNTELFTALENITTEQLKEVSILKNQIIEKDIEKSDLLKKICLGIIGALDSFEIIEENLTEKGYKEINEVNHTMKRYKSVQRKLLNLLQNYGITKIEFPENKIIVGLTEVVDTEPDGNKENGEIISIVRNGYIRGKAPIRLAQLIVVKN